MIQSSLGALALAAIVALGAAGLMAMTDSQSDPAPTYVTWDGIGPDKWASIWLIRRHLHPDARIVRQDPGSAVETGIAFDVPGADYMRDSNVTTFEQLIATHLPKDIANRAQIDRMAQILNEMEVSRWAIVETSQTGLVETGYRNLQFMFGREDVPFACYMAFFDAVEAMLERSDTGTIDASITDMGDKLCARSAESGATPKPLVQELPARAVLQQINQGKKVVFVDTRERSEFDEFHIPGAVHIPLRNVSAESMQQLASADLVVPYCVKDFRGYEVARAMSTLGVRNVAILNPYGIRGWRQVGLPVTGALALSQSDGDTALSSCARNPESCLK